MKILSTEICLLEWGLAMNDFLDIRGEAWIEHNGICIHRPNLVTNAGKNLAASLLNGSGNALSHVAVGSDNTTPALTDTALTGTEHERVAGSIAVSTNEITITASFGSGIGSNVTAGEFGIFNASSGGDMFSRLVTPSFTIASTDTVALTWKLYIGSNSS